MRTYLFFLVYPFALFLVTYAWKDWFPAVGGLVALVAVLPNPEMPREILGLKGLNIWNLIVLFIVPAWLAGRRREGLRWDLPALAGVLLAVYALLMSLGFARLAISPAPVAIGANQLIGEYFVNPLKFLLPALMFYDGARTRPRLFLALGSIVFVYLFLSLLVIREVGSSLSALAGAEALSKSGLRGVGPVTGLHRNAVSVMLAGAVWAIVAVRHLMESRLRSVLMLAAAAIGMFAQALTGGRGGYLAFMGIGLILGVLRWRKMLILAPVGVAIVLAAVPAVRERALYGLTADADEEDGPRRSEGEQAQIDENRISAGRLKVWPYMVAKIGESPLVGYGRLGYQRSGLYDYLRTYVDDGFPHPHSAYLEWLLDNGWLGMAPMIVLYGIVLVMALVLFSDSRHPLFIATGGVAFALVFAQLIGSVTGRSWYPTEETVPMWASVGLMLRVWVERARGGTDTSMSVAGGARRVVSVRPGDV
jgi:O-antigen ligase